MFTPAKQSIMLSPYKTKNKKMNIIESIEFSAEKPAVLAIKKNDKIKYIAIALGKDAVLKKHSAPVETTLLVIKGEIEFSIKEDILNFKQGDVYEIPVGVVHEVKGILEENLFTLLQEL